MAESLPSQRPIIRRLEAGEPAEALCARWRHEAFFADDGVALEESSACFHDFVARQAQAPDSFEIALVAEIGDVPVGFCLLVKEEIGQVHDLSPWLAALFVAPAYRRRGIATALVQAIEDQARNHGFPCLYLYTVTVQDFYAHCGWQAVERARSGGYDLLLMRRDL